MSQPAVAHQLGQPFPKLDTPIVDADGRVSIPWYYFLISMWRRVFGKALVQQVQQPISSPWFFTAPAQGFVIASGGQISLSRDAVNFFLVAAAGGQVVVRQGDILQVVWAGAAPAVNFFQDFQQ